MSIRDKILALQEELAGLSNVRIVILPPGTDGPVAVIEKPSPDTDEMNFDGDEGDGGGVKTFGVNSLGLSTKIMKILEDNGYETVQELQDAVEDGTFEDLKGVSKAIYTRVEKAMEEFKANHPEAGGEDEDGDADDDDTGSGDEEGGSWNVEDRCQVRIDGEWYAGTVKKIDVEKEKIFIHFDDEEKSWYPLDEVETLPEEE